MNLLTKMAMGYMVKHFPFERIIAMIAKLILPRLLKAKAGEVFFDEAVRGIARAGRTLTVMSRALKDGELTAEEIAKIKRLFSAHSRGDKTP